MDRIFQWSPAYGPPYKGAKPQEIGDALEAIRLANDGNLPDEAIVAAAKNKRSPLHKAFEWGDTRAASKYREQQAARLARSVMLVRLDYDGDPAPQRMYLCLGRSKTGKERRTAEDVQANEEMMQQVVRDALSGLAGWRNRYGDIARLAGVVSMVDQAIAQAAELTKKEKARKKA